MYIDNKNIEKNTIRKLLLGDYLTAVLGWLIFWLIRQKILSAQFPNIYLHHRSFSVRDYAMSVIIIPAFWLVVYILSGTYVQPYRKSRLIEIYRSFLSTVIGTFIIGIFVFANDTDSFDYYFEITGWYFLVHFTLLLICRMFVYSLIKKHFRKGIYVFNTLLIGQNGALANVLSEINNRSTFSGNRVVGYVPINEHLPTVSQVPRLGVLSDIEAIIDQNNISEVVIAIEDKERTVLEKILIALSYRPVVIKAMPDMLDLISGSVKTSNVWDNVFITIQPELIPDWQKVCKRVIDILVASLSIIILSPIYLLAFVLVRRSSPGPIFYKQERIGLFGKPFRIYKFRSMYLDSEKNGPALSHDDDNRITPWGKIMRKWRIDELPQFFNVLKSDMSLVGPRPERKFFIDQIVVTHPHYRFLHRVKPGITSWGMVQYGYAENIQQMIQRMKYDLLYIENCSLALDFKIMIFTLKVLFQGRGK